MPDFKEKNEELSMDFEKSVIDVNCAFRDKNRKNGWLKEKLQNITRGFITKTFHHHATVEIIL